MKTIGYKHQISGVEKSKDQDYFAYFMEMGTGKSWCLLADAERAYNEHKIECLFIIAPNGVYRNWETKEIPTHLSVPHKIFTWSSSYTKRQEGEFHRYMFREGYKLRILLINIEALISERVQNLCAKVLQSFPSMFAVDESTVIKNTKSQRTKVTLDLARLATFRRILTGSPITKSPYDLYSQSEFLSPKLSGFSDFLNYRHYYAIIEKGFGNSMVMRWNPETRKKELQRLTFEKVVGYKNLDKLNDRIQPWSYRVLKKDCLDLPSKVYIERDVEITKEQAAAYNQMKDMWTMEVEQGSVTANIALTKAMNMHRILCGHIKKDTGELLELPQKRVQALMDIIAESSDQKILIFMRYKQDIINIRKALVKVYGEEGIVEFHGEVSKDEREEAKKRIQEDSTCHFFLASKAACRGITLTACTLMIMFSYDYDMEAWAQAEDRIHRIGMTSCTIVKMKVPNSIDETMLKSHANKEMIAEEIVDGLKLLPSL